MMKRQVYLATLIAASAYFLARLVMKFALIEKSYAFFYNKYDLELFLPYTDVALTLLFFFSLIKYCNEIPVMKYAAIALMIFFIPFSFLMSFLSVAFQNEHNLHFIRSHDTSQEYLVVLGNSKGLHPHKEDPRDIYLFEKTGPLVYKKIGQSSTSINPNDLKPLSSIKKEEKKLSLLIDGKRIHFQKEE